MESLTSIITSIFHGLVDSIKGTTVIFYLDRDINRKLLSRSSRTSSNQSPTNKDKNKQEESKVLKSVLQCCALNGGVFWASIMFFEYALLPGINILLTYAFGNNSGLGNFLWSWVQPILSLLFGMIWVLPLFLLSKIVNSLWFQDIADSAYKYRQGRPQYIQSISKLVADILFNLLVQTLFLIQSMLVNLLPVQYIGSIGCFVHMCLLYSLYSFEYKWFNSGWELHKRLTHIEHNWPYFLGFGLPLAIVTQIPESYVISGCVFSILFPLFILSANEATPINGCGDMPLKLFSPVVAISNGLFNKTLKKSKTATSQITIQPTTPPVMGAQRFTKR